MPRERNSTTFFLVLNGLQGLRECLCAMIAWALLLLSALSSSAKPIYEDHNLRPFQAQKLGINDQTEGNHLTTDSQLCQQDCNFLIDSADSAGRAQASTLAEALVVTLGVSSRQTGLATRSDASGRGNVQGTEVLTAVPKIALVKRNQIKLVSFKPYSYLFPASIAAAQMRDFFDAVWLESTYRWPNERPPSDFFSISLGSFQLTISCLGATVP